MSMELVNTRHSDNEAKKALILGWSAAVVVGAGLLLSPALRRYLSEAEMGLMKAAVPDFERYMRIRSM